MKEFIPFWLILVLLPVIGIIGCVVFMKIAEKNRTYLPDIFTAGFGILFLAVFVMLDIGLALGKYVF